MKKYLLFLSACLILMTMVSKSYGQLPPPVGQTVLFDCDDIDDDGFEPFDLTAVSDSYITYYELDMNLYMEPTFHLTSDDAQTGSNPISNPEAYINITNPQSVYFRIAPLDSSLSLITRIFHLQVGGQPAYNEVDDMIICESDFDDVAAFNLTYRGSQITENNACSIVTYHISLTDAENSFNPIDTDTPYINISNPQTIYYREENEETGNYVTGSFDLVVQLSPIIYEPTPFQICDVDTDEVATFDLTQKNDEILGGQNPADFTISYYSSLTDAHNNENPLSNTYTNTTNPEVVYVSVYNNNYPSCTEYTSLTLEVYPDPVNQTIFPLRICEDNSDGIADFDLISKTDEITGGSPCYIIEGFYETQSDAENIENVINQPESYTNLSNPQEIYFVLEDIGSGNQYVNSFTVEVNSYPNIIPPSTFEVCDDNNDGLSAFDLDSLTVNILNGATDIEISYYGSIEDAEAGTNMFVSPYTNFVDYSQPIQVKIEDIVSGCYTITELLLVVNPIPIITMEDVYSICDGQELTLQSPVDPAINTLEWINSSNQVLETNSTFTITIPDTYTLTATNVVSGCQSSTTFVVNEGNTPSISIPSDIINCDENNYYDLTSTFPEILNGQDPNAFEITFFTSIADLENDVNSINNPTNYLQGNPETIFVKVKDVDSNCYSYVSFNIDSEVCTVTVDCNEPAVNTTYCYIDSDTTQFNFISNDGQPLTVVFNSGNVENNWDELIVLDSDGVTNLNSSTPFGNNGDLTGLVFTSTGDSITVGINSDSISGSCESSSFYFIPWDFDVYCNANIGFLDINAFHDSNSNSVFDTTESLFTNGYFTYQINNDGIDHIVNSSTGSFTIADTDEMNSYDITYNFYNAYENCFDVTILSFQDITISNGNTIIYNFPVVQEQPCDDLEVNLIPMTTPRPGFYYTNRLVLENNGFTDIASGTIEFVLDSQVNFDAIIYNPSSHSITTTATGFNLDFTNLQSGEVSIVGVQLYCPTSLNIGDLVTNTATYTTNSNDVVSDNDQSVLTQTVIASYDPNDKTESHGREILITDFTADDYLYYTIRFQNLGTASAETVRIQDMLDSQLDYATLRMLRASHDVVLTQTTNQLVWQFDNINLPPESQDEPNSHGFVHFKVKPNAGYSVGDIIPNTASIYFDFNVPVITNTYETEFVETLSTANFNQLAFNLYPNPAQDVINIQFNESFIEDLNIQLFDILGNKVMQYNKPEVNNSVTLNINRLQAGVYFVEVTSKQGKTIKKLVIE